MLTAHAIVEERESCLKASGSGQIVKAFSCEDLIVQGRIFREVLMETGILIPKEAKVRYVERRRQDLESLRHAFAGKDFSEFKKIGHQLKGNSATFGFMDLETIGKELEVAGLTEDSSLAANLLDRFAQWLSRASVAMAK